MVKHSVWRPARQFWGGPSRVPRERHSDTLGRCACTAKRFSVPGVRNLHRIADQRDDFVVLCAFALARDDRGLPAGGENTPWREVIAGPTVQICQLS